MPTGAQRCPAVPSARGSQHGGGAPRKHALTTSAPRVSSSLSIPACERLSDKSSVYQSKTKQPRRSTPAAVRAGREERARGRRKQLCGTARGGTAERRGRARLRASPFGIFPSFVLDEARFSTRLRVSGGEIQPGSCRERRGGPICHGQSMRP